MLEARLVGVYIRLAVFLLAATTSSAQRSLQIIASSPFSLFLQPVQERTTQKEQRSIEDSIANTLLKQHDGSIYSEMQAAIQKAEFLASSNRSQIQFFALAGRKPENRTISSLRLELNTFVEDILVNSPLGRASLFREIVSSGPIRLDGVQNLEIVPLNPVKTPGDTILSSSTDSSILSTLDVVLIVCSGLIFVGIMYMIIQHHQDRGYIENQRLRALNYRANDNDSHNSQQPIILHKQSSLSLGHTSIRPDVLPSTPSTIQTPERRDYRVMAMTPKELLGASFDGSSVQSIMEGLEDGWGRNSKSDESAEGKQDHDDSSDSSDDPFGVDVEASSSATTTQDDDERSKASSAVQEWMMSIQVIPTPPREQDPSPTLISKSSEGTQSSVDADSSGPSVAHTSLGLSSLDHRSLETSLASSNAGDNAVQTSRKVITIEV